MSVLALMLGCKEPTAKDGLINTRWRPVDIGGATVVVDQEQNEPWMMLDASERHVSGSGGCNRFSGPYTSGPGALRFGPLISTKMACPALDTETSFFRALEATRRYRMTGRVLELMDDGGQVLARLEERPE